MSDHEDETTTLQLAPQSPSPTQLLVRPPAEYLHPSFQHLDHRRTVAFFHPGYALDGACHDPAVELLRLPAYDNGGFHHGTALSAMSIIAFNHDGYFTVDTPNGERVDHTREYMLPGEKNYYYHLDDSTVGLRYPVCSSFAEWPFNPSTLPADWRSAFDVPSDNIAIVNSSHMSSAVRHRDVSCRVTDSPDATDNAHLIPHAEHVWFLNNGLHIYNLGLRSPTLSAIDDIQNGILLRKDLHYLFDQRLFVPVVKSGVLVSHYLKQTAAAAALYHNAQVRLPDPSPPVEFFWARFGWSILPYVSPFDERIRHIPRLRLHVQDAEATPKTRKRKATTPAPTSGGGRVLRKRGTAANPHTDKMEVANPISVPALQLVQEMERDDELRRYFFPQMNEETGWSSNATWQFANWYPGMDQMDRVKNWWRATHSQIGDRHGEEEREEKLGDITHGAV